MTFPLWGDKGGNLHLIEPRAGAQVSPWQPLLPAPWRSWPGAVSRRVSPSAEKLEQDSQKLQMESPGGALGLSQI